MYFTTWKTPIYLASRTEFCRTSGHITTGTIQGKTVTNDIPTYVTHDTEIHIVTGNDLRGRYKLSNKQCGKGQARVLGIYQTVLRESNLFTQTWSGANC